jgi:large subunit ribosomal protein LP1
MSSKKIETLDPNELASLACTYAALILHSDEQQVDANKITKLINAAGVKIEGFWPTLFANALKGRNIDDLLTSGGSDEGDAGVSAAAPAAGAAPAAAPAAGGKDAGKAPAKKEEPKKEVSKLNFII